MNDWWETYGWAGWLTLAVALGALELVSLDLFLVMLAGGALVGAVTALVGGPVALQIVAGHDHRGRPAGRDPARASYAGCTAGRACAPAPRR